MHSTQIGFKIFVNTRKYVKKDFSLFIEKFALYEHRRFLKNIMETLIQRSQKEKQSSLFKLKHIFLISIGYILIKSILK